MPADGFTYRELTLKNDYEGKVKATLISFDRNIKGRTPVLYLHGFVDYFFHPHLAEEFHANGYNFYALELRKYGHSLMEHQHPNYCRNLEEYFEEIDLALEMVFADDGKKVICLGHSTGGLIVPLYAAYGKNKDLIKAIILNSPFFEFNEPPIVRMGIPLVSALSKIVPFSNSQSALNPVYARSLHKEYQGEWEFDWKLKPVKGFPAYFAWLGAIKKGQDKIKKGLGLKIPVLLLHSSDSFKPREWSERVQKADTVLNVEDMIKYGPRLGDDVTLMEIKEGMHDLFLSSGPARKQAFEKMFAWLRQKEL